MTQHGQHTEPNSELTSTSPAPPVTLPPGADLEVVEPTDKPYISSKSGSPPDLQSLSEDEVRRDMGFV